MPDHDRAHLIPDWACTQSQYDLLVRGLIPEEVKDDWLAYFSSGWLCLHRRPTGHCVYHVLFQKDGDHWKALSAVANRNPQQHSETDDGRDLSALHRLLHRLTGRVPEE